MYKNIHQKADESLVPEQLIDYITTRLYDSNSLRLESVFTKGKTVALGMGPDFAARFDTVLVIQY